MLTENVSIFIDKISAIDFFLQYFHSSFQEAAIVIVGNKTDLIALAFLRQFRIAKIKSHLPYLCFPVRAEWQ